MLAQRAGGRIVQYGISVQGRPLRAAVLPSELAHATRVLCTANIHGLEFISSMIALGFLESFSKSTAESTRLRRRAEIWIIPCVNPDGYYRTWQQAGMGSLAELRTNANGVDLNRNFPLPPGAKRLPIPTAGSRQPGAATYRGPFPLSEPETAAFARLLEAHPFRASVNLHSFMGTVIPARVTDEHSFQVYRDLSHRFRKAQPRYRYLTLSSRWLDVYTGECEDYQHHQLKCWAICVETYPVYLDLFSRLYSLKTQNIFGRFNPPDPAPWLVNDIPGITAFLTHAVALPAASSA